MREAIAEVLRSGIEVRAYTKRKLSDWHSEVSIIEFDGEWIVDDRSAGHHRFGTESEAIDKFIQIVFDKKNLAICYKGILRHGLVKKGRHFDDLADKEIRALVKLYRDKYFDTDYPFVASQTS